MKSTKLIRWCGLASVAGGTLWVAMLLLKMSSAGLQEVTGRYSYLICVPLLLFMAGMLGLYLALRTGSAGAKSSGFLLSLLKWAGLFLAFVGLALAIVASLMSGSLREADPNPDAMPDGWYFAYLGGTVVLSVGMVLLGISASRAKALPRWNASPLIVGVLGLSWLPFSVVVSISLSGSSVWVSLQDSLTLAVRALFGIGWVALGYVLWTAPFVWLEGRMERLSGWMGRLAFFDILETLGKLAVLVAVIYYFTQYDDQVKQKHYQAWQVITAAQEQGGTGGRIEAMQELNDDGQSLVGLSAEGAFLERIDLKGANLSSARLQDADLTATDLQEATLWRADLDDAYLGPYLGEENNQEVTILEGADLREAFLRGTVLEQANLRGALLNDAKLDRANLSGADLRDARLDNAVLPSANLSPWVGEDGKEKITNLRGAVLNGANLYGAKLTGADLRGAMFNEEAGSGAFVDLRTAVLSDADLRGAEFVGADLDRADLSGAKLEGADFRDTNLRAADIRDSTDLREAKNLTQEQIDQALGDETTQIPENLQRPSWWDEALNNIPGEGEIPSGDYVSSEFLPQIGFSFRTEGGWQVNYPEVDNHLAIQYEEGGVLDFTAVQEVYDPREPARERVSPPPDNLLQWFQGHPYLQVGDTAPVKIGNASGVQFDVSVPSAPDDFSTTCGSPCVPLFPLSDGGQYHYFEGAQRRVVVLEFSSDTVVISMSPTCVCLPRARELLESMVWGGTTNVSPGLHSTEEFPEEYQFGVPFSFSVGEGWQQTGSSPDSYALTPGVQEDLTTLNFVSPSKVYDPTKPTMEASNAVDAPETAEGMVDWFQKNDYLEVGDPKPISVGDADGVVFDATVSNVPVDYPTDLYGCDGPCVPLFTMSSGSAYYFLEGYRNRVIVLDVGGETAIISIESPEDKFDEFLPRAEEVLKTVNWEE